MTEVTPEIVREFLDYDPETGGLMWKVRDRKWFPASRFHGAWNTRYAGKAAFTSINTHGYYQGQIFNTLFRAHRVIWAHYYGEWPQNQIDHINGFRDDNRIRNLRDVTNKENSHNSARKPSNTSGVCGVSWVPKRQKWQVYINAGGKRIALGRYKNKQEAIAIRKDAERKYGYSERHGS